MSSAAPETGRIMQSLDTGAAAQQKHPARQSCISNRYILLVQVRFVNTGTVLLSIRGRSFCICPLVSFLCAKPVSAPTLYDSLDANTGLHGGKDCQREPLPCFVFYNAINNRSAAPGETADLRHACSLRIHCLYQAVTRRAVKSLKSCY